MKTCRLNSQNKAACLLKSIWRMQRQRKNYEQLKQCFILLQSNDRKYLQQRCYKKMKEAACVTQPDLGHTSQPSKQCVATV
ncbi:hypothetical protein FKM82_018115 [Ascaphus truei]